MPIENVDGWWDEGGEEGIVTPTRLYGDALRGTPAYAPLTAAAGILRVSTSPWGCWCGVVSRPSPNKRLLPSTIVHAQLRSTSKVSWQEAG